jgi:hypothetical protein
MTPQWGPGGPNQYIDDFLTAIGAPQTSAAEDALTAWGNLESGGKYPGAAFNPWNSELNYPGARDFNSAGVKNYATYKDGIAASARTFSTGTWKPLGDLLKSGSYSFTDIANEVNAVGGKWGAQWPLSHWIAVSPGGPAGAGAASDPGAAVPSSPVPLGPIGRALGADKTSAGGGCPEGDLFKLNLHLFTLSVTRCQGRAILGGVCILGGGLIVLVGLAFVVSGSRIGRAAISAAPGVRNVA